MLDCCEKGMTNKETASVMLLSISTVKFHLQNIRAKTGAPSTLMAILAFKK